MLNLFHNSVKTFWLHYLDFVSIFCLLYLGQILLKYLISFFTAKQKNPEFFLRSLSQTHRLFVSISPPPCSVSFFMASTRQTSNRRRPRPAELNLLGNFYSQLFLRLSISGFLGVGFDLAWLSVSGLGFQFLLTNMFLYQLSLIKFLIRVSIRFGGFFLRVSILVD